MSNEDNDRLRRLKKSEEETQGVYSPAPVDPASKTTDKYYRPALDKDNMPLPRRVDEIDVEGTRVTRAAYEPTSRQVPSQPPSVPPPQKKFSLPNLRGNLLCPARLDRDDFHCGCYWLCVGSFRLSILFHCKRSPDVVD
jgi:hypothetical protein